VDCHGYLMKLGGALQLKAVHQIIRLFQPYDATHIHHQLQKETEFFNQNLCGQLIQNRIGWHILPITVSVSTSLSPTAV